MAGGIDLIPIKGLPEIKPGDDLVRMVIDAARQSGVTIKEGDIIVFAAKILSKVEGRFVRIEDVKPTPFAYGAAKVLDKDPRVVEIILREALRIIKMEKGKLIVENMHGVICANAGVDLSNVRGGEEALLLPKEPDSTARALHEGFRNELGIEAAVVVTDTVGRPWRDGLVQVAIGCYGISPMKDYRGEHDSKGFDLQATVLAQVDEVSSAAGLLLGKTEGVPVVIVRGYNYDKSTEGASKILRNPDDDLFR
ncbi:MAG: coenzyme F420-0:L-glutamate ligase [Candidatus Dadabacteria bacterium]|nr:coenzyme F420-0:L-glutamate ligase [Candidatus Dadabacteria bacterium]